VERNGKRGKGGAFFFSILDIGNVYPDGMGERKKEKQYFAVFG